MRPNAAYQIMDGLCSGDGFWCFQPWLIGQGREWYEHAVRDPDNPQDPAPTDRPWDFDSPAAIQRRLPRIAEVFPRGA